MKVLLERRQDLKIEEKWMPFGDEVQGKVVTEIAQVNNNSKYVPM